ncbi:MULTISPECIES: MaoC family dehydratase N-terminal domain-containing protein [unclassified Pseudonocardia]|uniref:FAS1-like dehydratase domain-containing protein n=1 Tax=unclassified Pseudonocardia TaxID=2619320 RepID=UPI0001FFEA0C|nr:MaoC family dehydratase N-terminal domain-containing protein [Pseudonocardia sp. Ae707_Ps1]
MRTEPTAIGDVVDEVAFTVESGKIREFALATHTDDPVHTDSRCALAAGFGGVPATATHVVVSGHYRSQSAMVERLGLDLKRVVVGGVRWRYHRPLTAGDVLTGTRRLTSDEQLHSGTPRTNRRLVLTTVFVDRAGRPAVEWHETIIERGTGR